ncbi:E3 ubiquitin-protein ligase ZSWIM2 isoform X2 [Scophthalmus maximus]|uniref:E3 ubiquitin-protein ligase ZSWIM2 isoform X2 n=1 Tax=Scophthalmus maximus TaxID=52904 RepID=UPI001FA846F6|nr:E3 ubiquitin-protein ligase ZSWIM2 isoform X2 [Scophthalmus maximus]
MATASPNIRKLLTVLRDLLKKIKGGRGKDRRVSRMFRNTSWRKTASDAVSLRQDQALSTTVFLLKSYGPTGFLLQEEGATRNHKVCLGDPHTCTCPVFTKEREPCQHICWVLLRKFRLPREHEYSFQHGLVERQILDVLHGLHQDKAQRMENAPGSPSQVVRGQVAGSVCRKLIQAGDVCPICQEELLEKKLPVSHCRFGCGNNVHISCMKVWADHQKLTGHVETVTCPLCREAFSTVKLLEEQVKNATKLFTAAEREKPNRHLGVVCHVCRVCPITGECFKCIVCSYFYLCEDCLKKGCHPQHPFASRTKRRDEWRLVAQDLLSFEPEGATCQTANDSIIPADHLSENVLGCLATVRVRSGSRLLDEGQQCRICLLNFTLGQCVRTLPCQHKFHTGCVDGILRKSNSCPLDGFVIYDPSTWGSREKKTAQESASDRSGGSAKPEHIFSDLFLPGVQLQHRSATTAPSHGPAKTINIPQELSDRFFGLCITTANAATKEGVLQKQQSLVIPESGSFDQPSASNSGDRVNTCSSEKTDSSASSPYIPVVKVGEQPQVKPFVGVSRPGNAATVAFPAWPERKCLVTTQFTNKKLTSDPRMFRLLINAQQRRKKES